MTFHDYKFIKYVTDVSRRPEFERVLTLVDNKTNRFYRKKLADRNWIVVPVESGAHLDEEQRNLICQFYGCEKIILKAAPTEDIGNLHEYLEFPSSEDALEEFSRCYGAFSFLMWDCGSKLTFSFTVDDYFSVAGHRTAIEALFGRKLPEIHTEFKGFASEFWTDPSDQVWVEELFRDFNLR